MSVYPDWDRTAIIHQITWSDGCVTLWKRTTPDWEFRDLIWMDDWLDGSDPINPLRIRIDADGSSFVEW